MSNLSVIIRLQNLPWSANAADIRAYFSGLSIPEGGVHIVGGEQGDAFIAFSTDEDARQAMLRDGGKLKEIKIKLLLSSRTEMLKIIEQARQQTFKLQTLVPHQQSTQPSPQNNQQSTPGKDEANESQELKSKMNDDGNNIRREKRERSTSRERGREPGRSKEGDRIRDRSRNRERRDRERDRRRRDRSRSRDRYRSRRSRSRDRKRSARGDSKDSHRGGRHSRDSDTEKTDSSNSKNESGHSWESGQQISPSGQQVHKQQGTKTPLLPDPPAVPQMLLPMQQNGKDSTLSQPSMNNYNVDQERRNFGPPGHMGPMGNFNTMPPMRGREGWPPMGPGPMVPVMNPSQMSLQRPPMVMPDMPMSSYPPPGFPQQQMYNNNDGFDPMWRMMSSQQADNNKDQSGDTDVCIEIRGLPLNVSYIDVKKLFDGLNIPSDGIKMINDNHGNRTGIAYVKFSSTSQKKLALNQHGKKVRSNIVEVLHLRDDLYRAAVDNFKPEKDAIVKPVDMDIDNGESSETNWSKDGRRGDGRGRKFQDSNSYRGNQSMRQDPRSNRGSERNDRMGGGRLSERDDILDRLEMSNVILIKGLPSQCTERDILDFFSELGIAPLNINIMQDNKTQGHGEAYCQFETEEEADKAAAKNGSNMGRYVVSIEKVLQEDFMRATGQWKPPAQSYNSKQQQPQQINQPPSTPLLPLPPQYQQFRPAPERTYETDEWRPRGDRNDREGGNSGGYGMKDRYNNNNSRGDNNNGPMMRGNRNDGRGSYRGGGGGGGGGGGNGGGRMRFGHNGPPMMQGGSNHNNMNNCEQMGGGPSRMMQKGPPSIGPPYIDGDVVENFGKPGCVVALENLHFRADIDEIMSLFSDFEVEHEDIIRRFDDRGRPTGDARVCLKSPAEAMRAVRQIAYSQLRGRTVKINLLQ